MIKASVLENILRFKILRDHLNEYVCNGLIHFVGLPYIICDETQGKFKIDLIELKCEPMVPGDAKLKGEVILENVFGILQHLISFSFSWS